MPRDAPVMTATFWLTVVMVFSRPPRTWWVSGRTAVRLGLTCSLAAQFAGRARGMPGPQPGPPPSATGCGPGRANRASTGVFTGPAARSETGASAARADSVGTAAELKEAPAMEYLVTMTTQVPGGTTDEVVQEIRGREAARSRELAAQGHLLRLWRPPLQPGEWRTLGLFAAADEHELEDVLASMPLRIWRSDEVVPLSVHPNDPPLSPMANDAEFLTTFEVTFPDSASEQEVADMKAREADRTRELAEQGHLVRLWMLPPTPGSWRALGLWRAEGGEELQLMLKSLPMDRWMTTETTPLTEHPNDPGRTRH